MKNTIVLYGLGMMLLLGSACQVERRKTDAELGLTPQQAQGRKVFDAKCARCHEPYSSSAQKGPSLKKLYRREYLPSGLPLTDQRVMDSIVMGRKMMPAFDNSIPSQQMEDLIAYLKTL